MLRVFKSRKCVEEIINPHHGQVGHRKKENPKEKEDPIEKLYYDAKGGSERNTREQGGGISSSQPGWVSFEEFERRKAARARFWKKTMEGQNDFLDRLRRKATRLGSHRDFSHPYIGGGSPAPAPA